MAAVENGTTQINQPVIYVTGFGPFPPHKVNASQLAVERLAKMTLAEELGVNLVTDIIKVEYESVSKVVPKKWKELKPKLVVHVGVSSQASTLTMEQVAHNTGYNKKDNCGLLPQRETCVHDGEEVLHSDIRMDLVSSTINKDTELKLPCCKSTDPGRYLCDYIYYTSLNQDKTRSAFIHVPTVDKSSVEDTAQAIAAAIRCMYQQVMENDTKKNEENIPNGTQDNLL